jgi:hypothetical protein
LTTLLVNKHFLILNLTAGLISLITNHYPLFVVTCSPTAQFLLDTKKTCENETAPDFLADIILHPVTDLKCLCMLNLVLEKL